MFKGELYGEADVIIEGRVEGKIALKQHGVIIEESGRVDADISASSICVAGEVHGNLHGTEQVVLLKTGRVEGDIHTKSVTLETGAVGPGQANAVTVGMLYNALTVTGGPSYQISSLVGPAGRVGIGLPDISTRTLGRTGRTALGDLTSGGILNLVNGDLTAAQGVVRAAIATVAICLNTSCMTGVVNVSSANSMIRDTDFAVETTRLSRSLILYQASLGVLGQASGSRWSVLNLLA